MTILGHIHAIADYLLSWVKLEQNAEIGWRSFNRKTGKLEREQQTLWKKLKLLVLFNPLMEWIDRTHLMRLYMHEESVAEGLHQAHDFVLIGQVVDISCRAKRKNDDFQESHQGFR